MKSLAKEIETDGSLKVRYSIDLVVFRFQHTCVSYDTQLVNKIELSLIISDHVIIILEMVFVLMEMLDVLILKNLMTAWL